MAENKLWKRKRAQGIARNNAKRYSELSDAERAELASQFNFADNYKEQ